MLKAENYAAVKKTNYLPRIPLEGSIDLTYRCNNNCLHCWLRIPPKAEEAKKELSFQEIKKITDDARKMGCSRWGISGGEPMLRPDFPEIFDYITRNSISYSINTNGSLITPQIAKLMKRKGNKMIAIYGATACVHVNITRRPGSFEDTMRGFSYLKEAGAGFTVQIIPMRDNYNEFSDMIELAKSLRIHYRIGTSWLYLSAYRDAEKNKEIISQRLPPKEVVRLDEPDLSYNEWLAKEDENNSCGHERNEHLFSSCISKRRDFHIDPYGNMSFCCFIKDSGFGYDLRKGSFAQAWDEFIPSLAHKVKINEEYRKNCGSCDLRADCRWCPVYGYLEHGRFSAKVEYLCNVASENRRFKDNWRKNHTRYYKIADITIKVESDLPINNKTFHPKFKGFEMHGPGEDNVIIRHHFSLPDTDKMDLGREVYHKAPWAIYEKDNAWIYLGISPRKGDKKLHRAVVFNPDHTRARIYNDKKDIFLKGNLHSITMFPTDQILLARILADREGLYLHSCGVNFNGKGLLFAGHSEAGKSTIAKMLKGKAEILCDDRMIVRKQPDGFKIYGTWSHGDVKDISAGSAPLKAILFLEKSDKNQIARLNDKKEINKRILSCIIRPFITVDWWEKTLVVIDAIIDMIPCYKLYFDKSGGIVNILKKL